MAVSRPDPIIFNDAIKTAYVENSMKIVNEILGASVYLDMSVYLHFFITTLMLRFG